jgi:hypothetical protein
VETQKPLSRFYVLDKVLLLQSLHLNLPRKSFRFWRRLFFFSSTPTGGKNDPASVVVLANHIAIATKEAKIKLAQFNLILTCAQRATNSLQEPGLI